MSRRVFVDTGPLVSLLNPQDVFHDWAVAAFKTIESPFVTCDAVLVESHFLLRRVRGCPDKLLMAMRAGALTSEFRIMAHVGAIASMMEKYADVPMSLADACLVRMVELNPTAAVLTIDSDFRIYRHSGRRQIRVVMPPGR